MANDAENAVVAANGSVHFADVGATEPTNATSAMGSGWTDCGFISENGVQDENGRTIADIGAWQSFYAIRKIVTAMTKKASFAMREWKGENFIFAMGGGTIASGKYTPPPPEELAEKALAVTWQDGDKNYRLIYRRGIVSDPVTTTLQRAAAADLPIGYELLGPPAGVTDAWVMYTDDPAFAAGS